MSRRSTRAQAVRANDRAIRQATLDLVAARGFDAVTFTEVAKRAGLSVGAVYGRAETKSELCNQVWTASVLEHLRSGLAGVLAAAHSGSPDRVAAAFEVLNDAPERSAAAVEFLIAALFDDELDEVVGVDARALFASLTAWPAHVGQQTANISAANVLLLSLALGRILARRGSPDLAQLTSDQLEVTARMAGAPPRHEPMPASSHVTFVRDAPVVGEFDEPDTTGFAVSTAVVEVVSRVGYRRATIARMGRAAGMSAGALFAGFDTKAQLVGHAARQRLVTPHELWFEFPAAREYGPKLSRAMWVADVLRPENANYWAINLELARVAQFIPELADFRPSSVPHQHTNLGVMLLANYSADLHDLPYDVPFQAGFTT